MSSYRNMSSRGDVVGWSMSLGLKSITGTPYKYKGITTVKAKVEFFCWFWWWNISTVMTGLFCGMFSFIWANISHQKCMCLLPERSPAVNGLLCWIRTLHNSGSCSCGSSWPFRSRFTMKVNPVVRGWRTYSIFGKLFRTANASLFALVFSAGESTKWTSGKYTLM